MAGLRGVHAVAAAGGADHHYGRHVLVHQLRGVARDETQTNYDHRPGVSFFAYAFVCKSDWSQKKYFAIAS